MTAETKRVGTVGYSEEVRDKLLDQKKGIAIILVVLGHTIQSYNSNFDQDLIFRTVYSFHMPFFVLLAGAAASFWIKEIESATNQRSYSWILLQRIRRSALYLLVPFFSWSLFSYSYEHRVQGLGSYLMQILRRPDLSLWFLPVIFWCTTYLCIGMAFIHFSEISLKKKFKHPKLVFAIEVKLLIIFLIWLFVRFITIDFMGTGMTNFFHGGLFFYYLAGVCLQINVRKSSRRIYFVASALLFFVLVPFWSRIGANNFTTNVPDALNHFYVGAVFTVSVALFGSLALFLGIEIFAHWYPKWIRKLLNVMGRQTLGIYALHIYFIPFRPFVLMPILISVLISTILGKVPICAPLFLGRPMRQFPFSAIFAPNLNQRKRRD